MSAANYPPALALVLAHEGGYVNHPRDPGGATNRGITQKVYDAYRKYHNLAVRSVRLITDSEVKEIYNKNYWRLVRGDSLCYGLDYAVFDFAVNSGVSRAVRYLQRLLDVEDDGVIGFITLEKVEEYCKGKGLNELIIQYCANRMAFLKSLNTFDTFGRGWTRRVLGSVPGYQDGDSGVIDYAIKMASKVEVFTRPVAIGIRPDEIAGKAVAVIDCEAFPKVEGIYTPEALKHLSASNDALAGRIANGR